MVTLQRESLGVNDAAALLGISQWQLRRLERRLSFRPGRSVGGARRYTAQDLQLLAAMLGRRQVLEAMAS